eukprot:gene15433-21519_t
MLTKKPEPGSDPRERADLLEECASESDAEDSEVEIESTVSTSEAKARSADSAAAGSAAAGSSAASILVIPGKRESTTGEPSKSSEELESPGSKSEASNSNSEKEPTLCRICLPYTSNLFSYLSVSLQEEDTLENLEVPCGCTGTQMHAHQDCIQKSSNLFSNRSVSLEEEDTLDNLEEEDTLENLEVPCGCTGTQMHAHHDCIQKWVAEKGHLRCEICHQDYTVEYDVPPPAPPAAPVFQPMYIVDSDGVGRTVVSNGTHVVEVMDDSDQQRYNRHPGAQWGMTLMLFFMFMVLLHPADPDDGEYNWPPLPPPSPPMYAPGEDPYADSLPLFLLAVFIKILFIAIPMMMVFRIAARGAQQHQYEVMLRTSAYDAAMARQLSRMRSSQRGSRGPSNV